MRRSLLTVFCLLVASAPLCAEDARDETVDHYLREYGYDKADFKPVPDRWRIGFPRWDRTATASEDLTSYDSPYQRGGKLNPYRQNVLKGDYPLSWPVIGQHTFFVLTMISDTTVEVRDLPTPSGVSTAQPNSPQFFGSGKQLFVVQNIVTSFELFGGSTAFKPADWVVRITPVFQINYLDTKENNAVNVDVRRGTTRTDYQVGLQEAFIEKHIADLSSNYDFMTLTLGIQQFVADPRGLLFFDNNLGARVAMSWDNNRSQANFAAFYQLEKDTNSELNRFRARDQWVFVANYFRQDFLWPGYTFNLTAAYNHDSGGDQSDRNGVPARPPAVGAGTSGTLDVLYLGFTGDGHIGRFNVTHEFFHAIGKDRGNAISGQDLDISASMFFWR